MGSLRLFRPHQFQQLSKQRQDIGRALSVSPNQPCYSSFREFLLWPDLEVSAPQGGGGELSDYEKLRVARMEANTEFLRGLGLA